MNNITWYLIAVCAMIAVCCRGWPTIIKIEKHYHYDGPEPETETEDE